MSPAAAYTRKQCSDQRVCLRIATVLIFSTVKTHSYSGYCDDILNTEHSLDFNEMD